jgi:hypothetical protein
LTLGSWRPSFHVVSQPDRSVAKTSLISSSSIVERL